MKGHVASKEYFKGRLAVKVRLRRDVEVNVATSQKSETATGLGRNFSWVGFTFGTESCTSMHLGTSSEKLLACSVRCSANCVNMAFLR